MIGKAFVVTPLLIAPVIAYNALAFAGSQGVNSALAAQLFNISMVSGGQWVFTVGDALLAFALLMLFFEVVKSTSTRSLSLLNHGLSTVVLIICIVQFLLLGAFATSVFLMITLMALFDVLSGFTVSVVAARRDFGVGDGVIN